MPKKPTYEELLRRVRELEKACNEPARIEDYFHADSHQLKQIIEFLPDATFVINAKGEVLAWNRAIEALTGVKGEAMVGKGEYEYAIPFYRKRRPVMIDLVISQDHSLDHMYAYVKRHADRYESESFIPHFRSKGAFLYNTARCLYDADGGIIGAIESIRDITDQKRTQMSAEESRRQLSEVVDFLPDPTVVIDKNGVVQMWNRAMEDLTGIVSEDMVGKDNYEYALPFYGERRPLLVDLVLEWDEGYENKYISINSRSDGVLISESFHPDLNGGIYLSGTARALFDSEGNPAGAIESLRNISEIKKTEKALRDSEERYRNLFNSIRDAILIADSERNIVGCNTACSELFGYEEEEILGKKTHSLYESKEQFQEVGKNLEENIGNPQFVYTVNYQKKSGETFPGETGIFYLKDSEGNISGFIGLIRDISERLKVEDNLRKSESRMASLVGNLFDAMVVTDRQGTIQFVNPAACKLFARERDRLIGVNFGFPITKNETFDISINSPDGTIRHAEARATDTDWSGESAHLISIRDVTAQRQAQEDREKMNANLQQIQKIESIGTLAGGIAHDFNNILSPIIGFTEIAMDRVEDDPTARDCLDQVYQAGKRAKELVKQILTFSRQTETEFQPLLLSPIVKEVVKMLRSTLPTTIEIQQNVTSARVIIGDATGIHQILMNLCTNAKHAMEETGGTLSVTLEDIELPADVASKYPELELGAYVRLQVEDTGCGMEQSLLEKIFEPYFTTKDKERGTGLGLSVTHGIVKDHKGAITVDSRPGQGTVFDVYLPCSDRTESAKAPIHGQALPKGTERILLVDDEPTMVKLNRQILEKLGYQMTARTSSPEALELFKTKPADFDLVLTDMTMPHMTGDVLAAECSKIRPDVPVILTTGFSEKVNEQKAKDIGIQAFLYKPVSKADLARTVRRILDENMNRNHRHQKESLNSRP